MFCGISHWKRLAWEGPGAALKELGIFLWIPALNSLFLLGSEKDKGIFSYNTPDPARPPCWSFPDTGIAPDCPCSGRDQGGARGSIPIPKLLRKNPSWSLRPPRIREQPLVSIPAPMGSAWDAFPKG